MHFLSYSMAGTVIVQLVEKRMDFSVTSLFTGDSRTYVFKTIKFCFVD